MHLEYLIFNIVVIACPLVVTRFVKQAWLPFFKPFVISFMLVSTPFLIWDHAVTDVFWSFNPLYTTGWKVGNLPIEEVLFFLTVPYACIFVWDILSQKVKDTYVSIFYPIALLSLTFWGVYMGIQGLWYTASVYLLLPVSVLLDMILQTQLFRNKTFYLFLLIVVGLTLVFNGYLTARPVVTYNTDLKTNMNIFSIPIEDIIYGICLIGLHAMVYERVKKERKNPKKEELTK